MEVVNTILKLLLLGVSLYIGLCVALALLISSAIVGAMLFKVMPPLYDADEVYEYPEQPQEQPKVTKEERCPICHYVTKGEGHRCILTQEQL